jgi:hypothetical protein
LACDQEERPEKEARITCGLRARVHHRRRMRTRTLPAAHAHVRIVGCSCACVRYASPAAHPRTRKKIYTHPFDMYQICKTKLQNLQPPFSSLKRLKIFIKKEKSHLKADRCWKARFEIFTAKSGMHHMQNMT